MNSRIDSMVSHLRSARSTETAISLVRNQKRKRRLAHEDEKRIQETSLGPVNVYNPRQEGRLGKRFDILHPRASKAELHQYSPSETYRSRSPMSRDTLVKKNVVRKPHILIDLISSHSKLIRNHGAKHRIGYPMFSGI